jgi:hypothetical protein
VKPGAPALARRQAAARGGRTGCVLRAALAVFTLLAFALPTSAGQPTGTDTADAWSPELSLATIAPGHNDANAWYGHSAIVATRADGADYYTYRLHWPDDQPRAIGSALGGATFRMHRVDSAEALADYTAQGRAVRLLALPIADDAARATLAALEAEVTATLAQPYAYEPVDDNCATHIRDFVDAILGGALSAATQGVPAGTRRAAYEPYVAHDVALRLALAVLVGPHVDRPLDRWDAMFLPLELEKYTQDTLRGVGHDADATTLLAATGTMHAPATIAPFAVAASVALCVTALAAGWAARSGRIGRGLAAAPALVVAVLLAPAAFLLTAEWLGDLGPYLAANANVLVASPFVLATVGLAVWAFRSYRGRAWLRRALAAQALLAAVGVASLLASHQDNQAVVWLLAPLHVAAWAGAQMAFPPASAQEARTSAHV